MGDSLVIPENMPQPKQMYLDQIEILKPIWQAQKASESPKASEFKKKDPESTVENNVKIELKKDIKPSLESGPSSSKSPGKVSRKGKTTKFNSKTEEKPMTSEADVKCNPGTMLDKMQKNSPYNLFFTTIPKSPETYKETNSITFTGKYFLFYIII